MRLLFLLLAVCWMPSGLLAAQPYEIYDMDAERLIAMSPIIAVVNIDSAPEVRIEDAASNPEIFKQRVPAKLVRILKGNLPDEFRIENQEDSTITAGERLAFLEPLDNNRYILSSAVSLRWIENDKVFWFPNTWVPLNKVIVEIIEKAATHRIEAAKKIIVPLPKVTPFDADPKARAVYLEEYTNAYHLIAAAVMVDCHMGVKGYFEKAFHEGWGDGKNAGMKDFPECVAQMWGVPLEVYLIHIKERSGSEKKRTEDPVASEQASDLGD